MCLIAGSLLCPGRASRAAPGAPIMWGILSHSLGHSASIIVQGVPAAVCPGHRSDPKRYRKLGHVSLPETLLNLLPTLSYCLSSVVKSACIGPTVAYNTVAGRDVLMFLVFTEGHGVGRFEAAHFWPRGKRGRAGVADRWSSRDQQRVMGFLVKT